MIRLTYLLVLSVAFQCVTNSLQAQDIHFSQFFNVPGNYNPADAGRFDGDYRVSSVYRSQWRTVTVPFQTFGLGADANKLVPGRPVGTGLAFYRDQAGDGQFTTTQLNLSGSYLLPFMKDSTQNISVGLQMGITNKSLDFDALRWGNQFDGVSFDPTLNSNEFFQTERNTVFDFHIGVRHYKKFSDKLKLASGLSLYNLTFQDQSFLGEKVPLFTRTNVNLQANYQYNEKLLLKPAFNLSSQGKFSEVIFGAAAQYDLTEPKGVKQAVGGGMFYRSGDAGYLYFEVLYDQWQAGVSYDFNLSDLRVASNGRGGIEFTLVYIFKKFRPRIVGGRVCPDFI